MQLLKNSIANSVSITSFVELGITYSRHSLQAVFDSGEASVTEVTFSLLGSNEGTKWIVLGTKTFNAEELNKKTGIIFTVDKPVSFIAASVTSFAYTGGGQPARLSLFYSGI